MRDPNLKPGDRCLRREDMEEWHVLEVVPEIRLKDVLQRTKQYVLIDKVGKHMDRISAEYVLEEFMPLRVAA
jgi:hypothetical protein